MSVSDRLEEVERLCKKYPRLLGTLNEAVEQHGTENKQRPKTLTRVEEPQTDGALGHGGTASVHATIVTRRCRARWAGPLMGRDLRKALLWRTRQKKKFFV
eukprot:433386-Amphidinium_carterae.2